MSLRRYVRLSTDGYYYCAEVVEEYDDPAILVEPIIDVIETGPPLGNAALPADVQAARWAAERGLPYEG